jgi:mRNA-degrading endonuclease RelE of RelBE toxin-antitoxin system
MVILMAKKPYAIFFTAAAEEHLSFIERKHRPAILDAIRERLSHDPVVENRNRKPLLRASRLGDRVWELRVGTGNRFRVFYDVDEESRTVEVVAVGEKIRNKIVILGEEIEP